MFHPLLFCSSATAERELPISKHVRQRQDQRYRSAGMARRRSCLTIQPIGSLFSAVELEIRETANPTSGGLIMQRNKVDHIIGAMSRLNWLGRKTIPKGTWLARMLARKPRMLVAVALANKMARAIWAMLTRNEDYRNPAPAVAA